MTPRRNTEVIYVRVPAGTRERMAKYQQKFHKKWRLYSQADTVRCMIENELDRCKIEGGTDEPELS